ncbi:MAG: hypothetical protein MI923_20755 [Phycisphaerales bacterium]|nr:hypothetical protein [Phycisphaerales bacterium]
MNLIRQKLVTLRNRARDLQNELRRWALYDDSVSAELREDLMVRMTPIEEDSFETDLELTQARLRPVSVQLKTLGRWYDYVLEKINEQFDQARAMLDQGRYQECLNVLNDVEQRMLIPNEETLGFAFRSLAQHAGHESHQKMAALDAIVRDLYLPTVKMAHERSIVSKEMLSLTPLVYLTEASDMTYTWRQHARNAVNFGRRLPVSMIAVPRTFIAHPWNFVAIAHEVGLSVYTDIELGWEMVNKLQTESLNSGVSPQTAAVWSRWHEVVFADVFGTLKLGPAYVSGMIELLGANGQADVALDVNASLPPAYLRWHIMLQTLQFLNFQDQARELANQIHMLCGDPNQLAQQCGPLWLTLLNECRAITGVVAFSPCQKLGGARVIDVAQPFLASELQSAMRVKDLLLTGDESCSSDDSFTWTEPLNDTTVTAPITLAGLRLAFDSTAEFETSRRMWVRFWCLMQHLTNRCDATREREDREFAPGDAALKSLAQKAVPALATSPIGRNGVLV